MPKNCFNLSHSHSHSQHRILHSRPARSLFIAGALLSTAILMSNANALYEDCALQAKSALEICYCEVKAKGKGSTLPNLHEFQKNPASTQRLLLKKPARQAGVTLPPDENRNSPTPQKTHSANSRPTPSPPAKEDGSENSAINSRPAPTPRAINMANALGNCRFQGDSIMCASARYQRQNNLQKAELASLALSSRNTLELPHRGAASFQNSSDIAYLSAIYPLYIEKMLSIGLGDSTMSFTRFVALYEEIMKQGKSFTLRFANMFELLKTERKTNSVKRRYSAALPTSLQQCMPANQHIIVCDNINKNWVYRR